MRPRATERAAPPEIADAIYKIAEYLLTEIRAELAERESAVGPDPWVPHSRWPWPRRRARALAASGAIVGARKVGRDWLARQSEIDRYIEAHAVVTPTPEPANDGAPDEQADVDAVLADMGLERRRTAGARRR